MQLLKLTSIAAVIASGASSPSIGAPISGVPPAAAGIISQRVAHKGGNPRAGSVAGGAGRPAQSAHMMARVLKSPVSPVSPAYNPRQGSVAGGALVPVQAAHMKEIAHTARGLKSPVSPVSPAYNPRQGSVAGSALVPVQAAHMKEIAHTARALKSATAEQTTAGTPPPSLRGGARGAAYVGQKKAKVMSGPVRTGGARGAAVAPTASKNAAAKPHQTPKSAQPTPVMDLYEPTAAPGFWSRLFSWKVTELPHSGARMAGISKPDWSLH